MTKAWFSENGKAVFCDSGKAAIQNDCPCGCPSFEGREIIYVDKHASGTGDGSSWLNAYTSIQLAVNEKPKMEIQIKGYGESDPYIETILLKECTFLNGLTNTYIQGHITGKDGFYDTPVDNTKVISIHSVGYDYYYVFSYISLVEHCTVADSSNAGFSNIKEVRDSSTLRNGGFRNCDTCINCNAVYGAFLGSIILLQNCTATNSYSYGFSVYGGTLIDCTAADCEDNGYRPYIWYVDMNHALFFSSNTFIRCTALRCDAGITANNSTLLDCYSSGNQNCAYITWRSDAWDAEVTEPNEYINCTQANNCLSENTNCTPGSEDYNCDEV